MARTQAHSHDRIQPLSIYGLFVFFILSKNRFLFHSFAWTRFVAAGFTDTLHENEFHLKCHCRFLSLSLFFHSRCHISNEKRDDYTEKCREMNEQAGNQATKQAGKDNVLIAV